MTNTAPRSSAMARAVKKMMRFLGMRQARRTRMPTAKAISVAIGIPQPAKASPDGLNPDFPLENNYVQVLHHGGPDALAHKPQNQARFFLGTDNSK